MNICSSIIVILVSVIAFGIVSQSDLISYYMDNGQLVDKDLGARGANDDVTEGAAFKYDDSTATWVVDKWDDANEKLHFKNIRIVGYNVLTDTFFKKADSMFPHKLGHADRRKAAIDLLEKEDADIIGLNEVSPTFLKQLLESKWVQKSYLTTRVEQFDRPFGNVLLSKIPIKSVHTIRLATKIKRQPDFVEFVMNGKKVGLTIAHLSAHVWKSDMRKTELMELAAQIKKTRELDTSLIFGDVNFHGERENIYIPEGYNDIWQATQPNDPGYTFDCVKNKMIPELLPHFGMITEVQTRLDRFFLSDQNSSPLFDLSQSSMKIIADKPVFPETTPEVTRNKRSLTRNLLSLPLTIPTSTLSVVGDLVGLNLFRNPKKYLFPSDHFGLQANLKLN
eukprot:TRINITY_DN166_c0_g1_i2.p1 TRINITY_DN166_c0_g1~~TRINITY_DN166_c0_g1_i2.p1  ORF type:complete len:393 (+),score=63.08 TRINITY_DN166_c0_g1_i2:67-1245(+)